MPTLTIESETVFEGVKPRWIHPRLWELVEAQKCPATIMHLAGIPISGVLKWTFESCSFVAGLKDRKTLYSVCFCPQMITKWEEKENPLFEFGTEQRKSL